MLRQIVLNLFLAFVWMLLHNAFTLGNFLSGFIVGAIVLFIFRRSLPGDLYLSRLWGVIDLTLVFLWEVLKANFTVAGLVLAKKIELNPGIVSLPIEIESDFGIVVLANMITLTPGSLSVDITPDRKQIILHVLNITSEDEVRREIKETFERRILRITRGY